MPSKARSRKRTSPDRSEPDIANAVMEKELPRRTIVSLGLVALGLAGLGGLLSRQSSSLSEDKSEPTVYSFRVVRSFRHDPDAFTQGLLWSNGSLFESTGLYGRSSLREVQLKSNGQARIVRRVDLDRRDFGEGLAQRRGQLWQLLWKTGKGIRYSAQAGKDGGLNKTGRFQTPLKDGWGIEFDGEHMLVTDSGHDIFFLDPDDFHLKKKVSVTDGGRFIEMINEMEIIGDELWANVYGTDCLARIDKTSGFVTGWVLLDGILDRRSAAAEAQAAGREAPDVLNGIAWDPDGDRIFVTGKLWPKLYEIRIEPTKQISLERARRMCIPKINIFRLQ